VILAFDIAIALLPVLVFLGALMLMDSYKLVPVAAVLASVGAGIVAAFAAYAVNRALLDVGHVDPALLRRLVAPLVEETFKAVTIVVLIRRERVGFLVDAGVYGFATGSGFAVVEGVYYLGALAGAPPVVWIVRGLGTAVMHGSTTALVGILSKDLTDRHSSRALRYFVPGLALAVACHSLFNQLLFAPLLATAAMLVLMPALLFLVFERSERATRDWLGRGFDSDAELLDLIASGEIANTPTGAYLDSLRDRFPGTVVADMLCLLQIHAELSMRAKGLLIARAAGVDLPPDPEVRASFAEMRYLERAIGPTGRLAILPLRRTSSRDLWQLTMLEAR
jgi:RsiW-degrading membrane proteinase PrsW (M82 family)